MYKDHSFSRSLLRWYKKNARDLPWRRTSDPYQIWISEIMLQQTTVSAVIPYFLKWVRMFPQMKSVARAPLPKVLKAWQGLGYYQRARNIHKTARIVCREHDGKLPAEPDVLKRLPGFGPYTTNAVLSIAFDQRRPIIDANVRRVAMRILALRGAADASHDKAIYGFLDRVMPVKDMSSFNQALMELGALVCQPSNPRCGDCPQRSMCGAFRKKLQDIIPAGRRKDIQSVEAAVALIEKSGTFFMQKRPARGLLAGMWEFPGGKIEAGETPRLALSRELREEIGVSLVSAERLATVRHNYTRFQVNLHAFRCTVKPLPLSDRTHKWVHPESLEKFPMAAGTVRITERLALAPGRRTE